MQKIIEQVKQVLQNKDFKVLVDLTNNILDQRLAYIWMLLSRKAINPFYRTHLLYNLRTGILNTLVRDLEPIASGQNPEKVLSNYKDEVKGQIESTAYSLAGKISVDIIDATINNEVIMPPARIITIMTTTGMTTETHASVSEATPRILSLQINSTTLLPTKETIQTSTNTTTTGSFTTHAATKNLTTAVHKISLHY